MDERWGADRDAAEEPYRGAVGRTRFVSVLLPTPRGGMRPVNVPVSVDVRSDRHLAERLFAGRLHDVGGGEPLAVPFVYHDPLARRFALVVPRELRHRVLQERAAVLRALADDPEHPVPPYVARVPVVLGLEGLRAWLQGAAAALFEEIEPLAEQDRGFVPDLADEATHRATTAVGEPAPSEPPPDRGGGERLSDPGEPVDVADLQVVEDEQELVAEPTRPRIASEPLAEPSGSGESFGGWGEGVHEAAGSDLEDLESAEALEEAVSGEVELVEEIAEEDLVRFEEDDEEEVSRPRIAVPREAEEEDEAATAVRSLEEMEREAREAGPSDSVPPAPEALGRWDGGGLHLQLREGRLWLHVRREEGYEHAFQRDEEVDLLVQLVEVEGAPVALLALVDRSGERPYVRRLALDPRAKQGRTTLEALAERFAVEVAVYDEGSRYVGRLRVASEREENVAWLLARTEAMRGAARVDAATAMERALAVPPPIRSKAGSLLVQEPPDAVGEAWAWMERVAEQVSEEGLRRLVLGASMPVGRVRATVEAALALADRWGLVPEERLLEAARRLEVGVLDKARIGAWIDALARTDADPASGLETPARRILWRRALDLATAHDVAVPRDVHERAWRLLHAHEGETRRLGDLNDLDEVQLAALSAEQLGVLLEHPRLRVGAAVALCRRGDVELLPLAYRALRRMSREDVIHVFPHVMAFGEEAADVLIDGLGARKTFVRQASAIGLGRLRLRRSVAPLVHLLLSEPSEVWREVARVLGDLGSSAVRSVARAARDPKGQEERLVLALAHLAVAGQREAVERMRDDATTSLAEVAREAMGRLPEAERHRAVISGETPAPEADPVLGFGWRLEEALSRA